MDADAARTDALLDALKAALADAAEHRLFRAGKLDGLFPTRAGAAAGAALVAVRDGLLETVRTESKGKVVTEWVRATPKAVAFVHDHDSPKSVLRELKDVLATARGGVPGLLDETRAEVASLSARFEERAAAVLKRLDDLAVRWRRHYGGRRRRPLWSAGASGGWCRGRSTRWNISTAGRRRGRPATARYQNCFRRCGRRPRLLRCRRSRGRPPAARRPCDPSERVGRGGDAGAGIRGGGRRAFGVLGESVAGSGNAMEWITTLFSRDPKSAEGSASLATARGRPRFATKTPRRG